MKLTLPFAVIQNIVLIGAVILSGAHAKDAVKVQAIKQHDVVKTHAASDDAMNKVSAELHPHVDKQTLKVFHTGSDVQQSDRRSLQLLEKEARSISTELRFGASIWLRLLAAKLML